MTQRNGMNSSAGIFEELKDKKELLDLIVGKTHGVVTLLYGAKEEKYNNAAALKEYIDKNRL